MASTLSTPITASATMMVRIASRTDVADLTSCSPPPPCVSFQPIQISASPPTTRKPGIFSSQTTTPVSAKRTAMAPAVPQRITRRCISRGTFRAARPMTIALSPASTRSISTIAASADHQSGVKGALMLRGR